MREPMMNRLHMPAIALSVVGTTEAILIIIGVAKRIIDHSGGHDEE